MQAIAKQPAQGEGRHRCTFGVEFTAAELAVASDQILLSRFVVGVGSLASEGFARWSGPLERRSFTISVATVASLIGGREERILRLLRIECCFLCE